jgi:hypothetical protein
MTSDRNVNRGKTDNRHADSFGRRNAMKRIATTFVLTLILSLVAAQAQAGKNAKPAKADRAAKKDQKGVVGTVLKVDGSNIVVQGKGKNAGEVTIATDASTKFQVKGKEGTIADVKAGAVVVASPATGTAQKIVVRPGKADRPPKGAKAAKPKNA